MMSFKNEFVRHFIMTYYVYVRCYIISFDDIGSLFHTLDDRFYFIRVYILSLIGRIYL
jgi:hypothetical protein